MIVHLQPWEMAFAAKVGVARRTYAIANELPSRFGFEIDPWESDVEGAAAEMAVAQQLDRYWDAYVGPGRAGDIGPGIEVRSTVRPDGRLLLHPGDRDDATFYLVRGRMPLKEIVGQISGADGKRPEWWREPRSGRPCFVVPIEALTR